MHFRALLLLLVLAFSFLPGESGARNLHLIERKPNGFAIYRSGLPSSADFVRWCRLGVTEVMVLSGDSSRYEGEYLRLCPKIHVVKEVNQNLNEPLRTSFLHYFDQWVSQSRKYGKKILFRCVCGCHRTGRLAAYYEMKYMKRSASQAIRNMLRFGKRMDRYPFLIPQVKGLYDLIKQRPCSQSLKYCPVKDD